MKKLIVKLHNYKNILSSLNEEVSTLESEGVKVRYSVGYLGQSFVPHPKTPEEAIIKASESPKDLIGYSVRKVKRKSKSNYEDWNGSEPLNKFEVVDFHLIMKDDEKNAKAMTKNYSKIR